MRLNMKDFPGGGTMEFADMGSEKQFRKNRVWKWRIKLRRYCVNVQDGYTPLRVFWTLRSAESFYRKHRECSNIFKWDGNTWQWIYGVQNRTIRNIRNRSSDYS